MYAVIAGTKLLGEVTAIYQQKIDAEGQSFWHGLIMRGRCLRMLRVPRMPCLTCAPSRRNPLHLAGQEELAAVIGDKVSSDKGREWKQRLKEYNDEKNCAAANSPIATSVQWRQSPLAAR